MAASRKTSRKPAAKRSGSRGNPAKARVSSAPPKPDPVTARDWIGAARLRTLPLAISPILVGTGAAIAVGIMMLSADAISRFVTRHPTIKMLALSFLLLIGFTLVVEGLHQHIAKGYIYFAMAFSLFVELLNIRMRSRATRPVKLVEPYVSGS